jgi:hypothetical protein
MLSCLKIGITTFSATFGKRSYDRPGSKIYLSGGTNIVGQSFIIKPSTPSSPTDLDGLRRSVAFSMSNSVMGGNCKKLLDN